MASVTRRRRGKRGACGLRAARGFRRARFEPLEPRNLLTAISTDWINGDGPSALMNALPTFESQAAVLSETAMAPGSGVFAVYVESGLRTSIQSALDVYVADLTAEGYQVSVLDFSGTAEQLRADLYTRWSTNNLEGALFVGDLPYVMFTSEDNWSGSVTQATYAHDLYFMDLDGTYVLNATGLDGHSAGTGDVGPEIYVSRITTSNLSGVTGRNEVTLINQYFAKDHAYRHGGLSYQNRGIVFADDDWSGWGVAEMDDLYSEVLAINSTTATNKSTYVSTLPLNYESILECIHSSSTYHALKVGAGWEYLYNSEIAAANPRQAFYNMFNCSSAAFNVANNLIGTYVYSGDYGLNAVGSTKTGSMRFFSTYYAPQGQGKSLGEAFRIWFDAYAVSTESNSDSVDWYYGMTMQGDPTLKPARMPYSATVTPASGLATTEAGQTATFTVVLDSVPGASVTIPVSSTDPTEGTPSRTSLVFTTSNWSTPQTVTVTGVNDAIDDGSISYSIALAPAQSTDLAWNGYDPADVGITNSDDDTAGVVVAPTSGLVTSESGTTARFSIVLATQPLGSYVNIGLTCDDPTEGALSTATVSFDRTNWSVPQTVTVTGVGDVLADGDQPYHVVTGATISDAADYSGLAVADVSLVNLDVSLARVIIVGAALITSEAGEQATFTVRLDIQPTDVVSLGLTTGDPTEGTLSMAALSFNASNWSVPQTVTVTGVDDEYRDGDVAYAIVTGLCTSTDPRYNQLAVDDVAVTNLDNDRIEIRVAQSGPLVTDETGRQAVFAVTLGSRPTANVRIDCTASDPSEGQVSPASVTFTPAGWNVPQTVTVNGIDDLVDDGAVTYRVSGLASSTDAAYQGLAMGDVEVVNNDNGDVAGVAVSPAGGLTTTEWGSTATFTVRLDTQPVTDVTIGLSSSDLGEGTVAPASLTFTAGNWATPQTVTLTGIDDQLDDGDEPYTIITAATSSDAKYNHLAVDDVPATNVGRAVRLLDPDGNGAADALTDGILILRYLFAPEGQWNFADAVGSGAARTTRDRIKTVLDSGRSAGLDPDGNGTADALTDGILILRYLFAPEGQWSYADAIGTGATRSTREQIQAYLDEYLPTTPSAAVPPATAAVPNETPPAEPLATTADSTPCAVDAPRPASIATEPAVAPCVPVRDTVFAQWDPPAADPQLRRAAAWIRTQSVADAWWTIAGTQEADEFGWFVARRRGTAAITPPACGS
jgi:hypothetical protein